MDDERIAAARLRVSKIIPADHWLDGYLEQPARPKSETRLMWAYQHKPQNNPERHVENYLRGYIAVPLTRRE